MALMGSPEWEREMNRLVKKYTGWDSLAHMCRNSPTLRVSKFDSEGNAHAIRELRKAYEFVTGRVPFPQENWDQKRVSGRKKGW